MQRDLNEKGHIILLSGRLGKVSPTVFGFDLTRKQAATALRAMDYTPSPGWQNTELDDCERWEHGRSQAFILKVEELPAAALAAVKYQKVKDVLDSLSQRRLVAHQSPCLNCSFEDAEKAKLLIALSEALTEAEYQALVATLNGTAPNSASKEFLPPYGTGPARTACLEIETFRACLREVVLGEVAQPA